MGTRNIRHTRDKIPEVDVNPDDLQIQVSRVTSFNVSFVLF